MSVTDTDLSKPTPFPLVPKIINGGIAGIIGISGIFPLDVVKTRLQAQQAAPNGEKIFKNMLDCFRKTWGSGGFFAMYHGLGVNILLITPAMAIELAANDYFRHRLTKQDGCLPLAHQMAAGGLAGAFQSIVTTPMELLKIQMQNAGHIYVPRTSATQIVSEVIKRKGVFGLFRGMGATSLRDVTFCVVYYPLFATLNGYGPQKADAVGETQFWFTFLSGCAAGSVAAWIVNPFDVVKTRLQSLRMVKGEKGFKGIGDCILQILRHEGLWAFYSGGLSHILVTAPLCGIVQMVYFLGVAESLIDWKWG